MCRFFITRFLIALLVALTVSVVGFTLLRLSGNLAAEIAGEYASQEEIQRTARAYGLDKPLHIQYLDWVQQALKGHLGASLLTKEPVASMILGRLGVTVRLAVFSLIAALLVSVPLGTLAATRPNSWMDRAVLVLAGFGQAMPNFFLGLVLIILFGVKLRWTPISGSDTLRHFILPTLALGTSIMPAFMRLTRTGMIEILESDFIRTARAKGLSAGSVVFKHALRNAILPVVSLSAVSLGGLMGGSVIIETVFALNGIGFLAYQSIQRADFPVVQSIVVFISFVYILLTLISDLINARLDPRIRLR
jgi:ABC-type dipeptide/oligopeptide/nickel transport system permease component